MKMKVLAIQAILMLAVCVQVNGAGVFPSFIDDGPYDGMEDALEFNNSASGFLFDRDGSGSINLGDEFFVLYGVNGLNGSAVAGSPFVGVAVSGQVGVAAGGGTLSLGNNLGSTDSVGQVFGYLTSSAVLLTSETLDFSALETGLGVGQYQNMASYVAAISGATVEVAFDLAFGNVGTDPGTLSFVFGGNMQSNIIPPTSFIDVTIPRYSGLGGPVTGTADIAGGSSGLLGGTSLATGASDSANVFALSGSGNGLVNPVPEPASILTLLGCVAGACVMGRRRRKVVAA